MVDLCEGERVGWAVLTTGVALVTTIPWIRSLADNGKTLQDKSRAPASGNAFVARLQKIVFSCPKRYFAHFYLLGLVTCLLILVDIFYYEGSLVTSRIQARSTCSRRTANSRQAAELGAEGLACLFLMFIQIIRRLYECLFVTRWGCSKMSIVMYLVGILHYQMVLMTIIVEMPMVETLGLSEFRALEVVHALFESATGRHMMAFGLFALASARQHEAIQHLANLRPPSKAGAVVSNTYAMPMAGWFQYVSGPHYLAEVLIYASLYLLAGQRARGIGQGYQLMLTWVFSNQALVAGRTHTWYQTKFKDYPRDRRRLVPGVW